MNGNPNIFWFLLGVIAGVVGLLYFGYRLSKKDKPKNE